MDQPKFERLLRLIKLLTGNTALTVEDIARKLDTSYRSIYRYLDTFQECGFAVKKMGAGIYQLVEKKREFEDLNKLVYFSDEEAAIVHNLIEGLDNSDSLKQNLKIKLASVYESAPVTEHISKKLNALNIRELTAAKDEKTKCILHAYKSSHSRSVTDRLIEPFEFTTNCQFVWGYEESSGVCKIFAISRIGEVEVLDAPWEHESLHKTQEMDIFRFSGQKTIPVRLELGSTARNVLIDEYPLAEKELRQEGSKWVLETKVCNLKGVGRFVIGLADDITVTDSPELEAYIREFTATQLSRY